MAVVFKKDQNYEILYFSIFKSQSVNDTNFILYFKYQFKENN